MSAVTSYSRTAANNNSAAPNGWPEGQAASTVNDCAREMMKGIVDEATNNACKVVASVAGTNTITGSMTPDITAYSAGMIVVLTPANTNTGATTLNIDSLGALDVFNIDGTACIGGELAAGIPAVLVLDSGADDWIITNPANIRLLPSALKTGNYTVVSADRGTALIYTGTGGHTFTIPDIATGAVYKVYNGGSGNLTVAAGSGITTIAWFNGSGTVGTGSRTLAVSASMSVHQILDGANKNLFVDGVGIT